MTQITTAKKPFGTVFTDHMFVMEWNSTDGWHNHRIQPYEPFVCDPAQAHFHYGQEIFEGMKAFKTDNNSYVIFRPYNHLRRMNNSANILCMPSLDVDEVLLWLKKLIIKDKSWVPDQPGTALYIRPTMIATQKTINLYPSSEYVFFIILSPVGALYEQGFNPIPILVSEKYTRASAGGVGQAKAAGNYAASMRALQEARKLGCAQVLWLDPLERRSIEEVGAMNIFFVINNTLVTPQLTDSILPGITRLSIIELSKHLQIPLEERRITIDEVTESIQNGALQEIFGSGTAAVITPVGSLHYKGTEYRVNNNRTGPITQKVFKALTDIHYGKTTDLYDWLTPIE